MARSKFTVNSVALHGKTVLLRADLDEIIEDGLLLGDYRIRSLLPTLRLLLERRCRIVIISHIGRPRGRSANLSLRPLAEHLSQLIEQPVKFVDDCIGPKLSYATRHMARGDILVCENLRFHAAEYRNDDAFARQLVRDSRADYVVLDAFGSLHLPHASIDAIRHYAPVLTGLRLAAEYQQLRTLSDDATRPNLAIIGGRDTSAKVAALPGLLQRFDHIYLGGMVAAEFIAYHRYSVGATPITKSGQTAIDEFYGRIARHAGFRNISDIVRLPRDVLVMRDDQPMVCELRAIKPTDIIIDIGPRAIDDILADLSDARTVIWNGPVGAVDRIYGSRGSFALTQAMTSHPDLLTAVLGGNTVRFVESFTPLDAFDIVSTGGVSALQLLAGQTLPGLESLLDAPRRVVYTGRRKA